MEFKYRELATILISSIASLWIITANFDGEMKFEDFAMGEVTESYYAEHNNYRIHLSKINNKQIADLIKGWEYRGKHPVILILGNSQTHSINKKQDQDVTFPEMFFHSYGKRGFDVLTLSVPNANFSEFYLYYNYLKSMLPIKVLVLPAFFDDTREYDIRSEFIEILLHQKFLIPTKNSISAKINSKLISFQSNGNLQNEDLAALDNTIQENSELYLNEKLEDHWDAWKYRTNIRGELFVQLYKLRNTIFNISAQSTRSSIAAHYEQNLNAFNTLLNELEHDGILSLCYIPPIRQDVKIPYSIPEYNQFISEVNEICDQYDKTKFRNIEAIVPANFWGVKASTNYRIKFEYDFMHFQEEGHQLVYDHLNPIFEQIVDELK